MAQSCGYLITLLLLNACQHISHLEAMDTTQLGGGQLTPMTLQGDESVLQFLECGGKALVAMDLRLE